MSTNQLYQGLTAQTADHPALKYMRLESGRKVQQFTINYEQM